MNRSIGVRILVDLLKGSAAAVAWIVGMVVGAMVAGLVGLPAAEMPEYMDATVLIPLQFLSAIPASIVLGECYARLPFNYGQRVLALFLGNYVLYTLANMLDAFLFSPMPGLGTNLFASLFQALATALVIARLWRPADPPSTTWADLVRAVPAWRFLAAWLGYVPIYYLIGLLVAPFTKSYYEDPAHSLGLFLPPLWAILAMQVPRGLVFLVAVLPLLFHWRGSRRSLWLWTGLVIFIQIAAMVMFQAYWLPPIVRVPHTLELLVDSFLQAGLYVGLLVPRRSRIGVQV